MRRLESIRELHEMLHDSGRRSIGFVPTMGYLHEGHLSLVRGSRAENDRTVVSIFVNPTQFLPGEDFRQYPRDIDRDAALLEKEGVDILFHPDSGEIYPAGHDTVVEVEKLSRPLCGNSRPGHFKGVATIVLKLFHIVGPDRTYFGQKDAQQAVIIGRMIRDLHLDIRLRVMPIVRDADGLALSSRNIYLSEEERRAALALPSALDNARRMIAEGEKDCAVIRKGIAEGLQAEPLLKIEYVETVSLGSLDPLPVIDPRGTLVACAIRAGSTRLIDNFIIGEIQC